MSLSISPPSYNAKAIQFVVEHSVSCYIKYKTTKLVFFFFTAIHIYGMPKNLCWIEDLNLVLFSTEMFRV